MHRAVLWTLLSATMLAACTSWQVQSVSPEQLIADEQPSTVRVLLQDGGRVVVNSPRISADSLLGVTRRSQPASVLLANISELAVRRTSVLKTVVLAAALGFAGYVVAEWIRWCGPSVSCEGY
jgi:hypothetical protein